VNSFRTGEGSRHRLRHTLVLNSAATIRECLLNLLHKNTQPNSRGWSWWTGVGPTARSRLQRARGEIRQHSGRNPCPVVPNRRSRPAAIGSSAVKSSCLPTLTSTSQGTGIRKHVNWLTSGFDLVGGRVFFGRRQVFVHLEHASRGASGVRATAWDGAGVLDCSVRRSTLIAVGGLRSMPSHHDTEFALAW